MPELCFTGGVVSVRSFPRDLDRRQKTAKDSFDIRPPARKDHTATLLLNGKVLVTGRAFSSHKVPLASAERYDWPRHYPPKKTGVEKASQ